MNIRECAVRVLIAALVMLAFPPVLCGAGEERHPITPEDLWHLKRVGSLEISPCGKWAAVVVTEALKSRW